MNYGYPGANTHLENHNVSEEGFWPSFTDIMMVIVMVFLLVTVAVILNNWALMSKLTTSIKAQQIASNLADNRQQQNQSLESKLNVLENNLLMLNQQYKKEKRAVEDTQQKLSNALQSLTAKENALLAITGQLKSLNEKYQAERLSLSSTNQKLADSEQKLSHKDQQLINIKQELAEKIMVFANLNKKFLDLNQESIKNKASLRQTQKELTENQQLLAEKETALSSLKTSADNILKEKQLITESLQSERSKLDQQLITLQTDYDTLDTKYQKLLRPARSSKGKFIASVLYKKIDSKRVIRFKSGPNGSYKTVTSKELAKSLKALKKKHKTDLYVKVVIPKKSGLSYNEAWKFTTNLQRRYDYYFQ